MNGSRAVNLALAALLVTVIAAGVLLQRAFEQRLEQSAARHLTTMLMLRASVLTSYLESLRSEIILWSAQPVVMDILERLTETKAAEDTEAIAEFGSIDTNGLDGTARPAGLHTLGDRLSRFARHHGYYDIFLISPEGDVLLTMAREADYGTNLKDGPYADTGLGRLFASLMTSSNDIVTMEDFSLYPPSNDEPAAFLGARVIRDGVLLGIYAVQIPEQPINRIMQFSAGMGETGETYLVGEDRLMRSTSRFFDSSTVLQAEVSGMTLDRALDGETGIAIVQDYRGIPVYSAYRPFEFEGIRWAVLAEQDVAEVRAPMITARWWLAAGLALAVMITLMVRYMLVRIVLPTSIAALLGLTIVSMESQADD